MDNLKHLTPNNNGENIMTMDDLRMLERAHENAVRNLQNLAVNIVERD